MPELIPLERAAERLGVSRATLWRRAKEWGLTIYSNPLDRRQRVLDWEEVERAIQPVVRRDEGAIAEQARV